MFEIFSKIIPTNIYTCVHLIHKNFKIHANFSI